MPFFKETDISEPFITSSGEEVERVADYCPDHRVEFRIGGNSEGLSVRFDLVNTGDDYFDCEVSLIDGNNDWASPRAQVEAMHLCTERFYALGLDTRFGPLVGTAT